MAPKTAILHALRTLQLLATITMLILFSIRLGRLRRLTHHTPASVGAVEGLLASSVVYTAIALPLIRPASVKKLLRLGLIFWDVVFVAAFIVVAVLTSPEDYDGAASCLGGDWINYHLSATGYCSLPWGPFILGILSTVSFSVTAALTVKSGEGLYVKEKKNGGSAVADGSA